nr:peptidyl-prolyl cis-trans isomerase FKBP62-like [Tanacetum cinerariifolium]
MVTEQWKKKGLIRFIKHETGKEKRLAQLCENYEATVKKALFSSYDEATVSFTENSREPASANEFVAPPNATIQITLELFSKKVFNEGEGYDRQNDGAIVQVKLIGKLHDGTVFVNKGDNEVPFEFEIDKDC